MEVLIRAVLRLAQVCCSRTRVSKRRFIERSPRFALATSCTSGRNNSTLSCARSSNSQGRSPCSRTFGWYPSASTKSSTSVKESETLRENQEPDMPISDRDIPGDCKDLGNSFQLTCAADGHRLSA